MTTKRAVMQLERRRKQYRRKRRIVSVEEKINLIKKIKAGENQADLCRKFDLSESTLRAIKRKEKQLLELAEQWSSRIQKTVSYLPRSRIIEKTENLLYKWYEDQRAAGNLPTKPSICSKARSLYSELCAASGEAYKDRRDFKASQGWFKKFRKCYNLDYSSMYDTIPVDEAAAKKYSAEFLTLIRGYQPQQVFSATQLLLAWKSLPGTPNGTTAMPALDKCWSKMSTERISLLLCGNASGDFVVKPMLIYRVLSPYCLRSRNIQELPVFWRARTRASQCSPKVTEELFYEWLTLCFIPMVRQYLTIMELPERCVLVLDADLLPDLDINLPVYDDKFVRLEFLPENTASLLQPVGLGVVSVFKCHYLKRFLTYLLEFYINSVPVDLTTVWRRFSISQAIDVIEYALERIRIEDWNGGWLQLWQEVVMEPDSAHTPLTSVIRDIKKICQRFPDYCLNSLRTEDIKFFLNLESDEDEKTINSDLTQKNANMNEEKELDLELEEATSDTDQMTEEILADLTTTPNSTHQMNVNEPKNSNITSNNKVSQKHVNIACDNDNTLAPINKSNDKSSHDMQKVQNINKALTLAQELIITLHEVNVNRDEHLNFTSKLNDLMQPYKELKEKLLQPSIREYFSHD